MIKLKKDEERNFRSMMRIITGSARGTKLFTLEGENTRPTAERVKEAIFSMIQFEVEGRAVLDLFAGSGQMALEALSRGAAEAVLVDSSRDAVGIIKKNIEKTRLGESCEVFCADYAEALSRMRGRRKFDIVFLDPPYRLGATAPALKLLRKYELLKPTSIIVCESGDDEFLSSVSELYDVVKSAKYGVANVTILKVKE